MALLPAFIEFLQRSQHLEHLDLKVDTAHDFLSLDPLEPESLRTLSLASSLGYGACKFVARQRHLQTLGILFGANSSVQPGQALSRYSCLSDLKALRTDSIDRLRNQFAVGAIAHLRVDGPPPMNLESTFMASLGRHLRCLELSLTSLEGLDLGCLSPLHALFPFLVELALEMLSHEENSPILDLPLVASLSFPSRFRSGLTLCLLITQLRVMQSQRTNGSLRAIRFADRQTQPLTGPALESVARSASAALRYFVWTAVGVTRTTTHVYRMHPESGLEPVAWPRASRARWVDCWTDRSVYDHVAGIYD